MNEDEVKMLASVERDMDDGKQPYVVWQGGRLAVMSEAMEMFNLRSGQTVSNFIAGEIMKAHVAIMEAKIALEKAKK